MISIPGGMRQLRTKRHNIVQECRAYEDRGSSVVCEVLNEQTQQWITVTEACGIVDIWDGDLKRELYRDFGSGHLA